MSRLRVHVCAGLLSLLRAPPLDPGLAHRTCCSSPQQGQAQAPPGSSAPLTAG